MKKSKDLPLFKSWPQWYIAVLALHAVVVLAFYILTLIFNINS